MAAQQPAGVLDAHVALQVALEQVSHRRRGRDRDGELERVERADGIAVGLVVEGEEHGHGTQHEPDHQPLDGLVGRYRRRQLALAEHAAAEVGERVREPDADQHRDQQLLAPVGRSRDVAQRHQEGQPVADPDHPQQRHAQLHGGRLPHVCHRAQPEREQQRPHQRRQAPDQAALVGDHDDPDHTGEPGDRERAQRTGGGAVLVHRDHAEGDGQRHHRPAAHHHRQDRDHDQRHRDQDAPDQAAHRLPNRRRRVA